MSTDPLLDARLDAHLPPDSPAPRSSVQLAVLAQREWALTRRDPVIPFLVIVAPLIVLLLLGRPLGKLYLDANGGSEGNAYAALAPRAALSFGFFAIGAVAFAFFRERWFAYTELLESWPVSRTTVVLAKVAVPWLIVLAQFNILSILPLLLVGDARLLNPVILMSTGAAAATWVVALGVVILGVCRTEGQAGQMQNLFVLLGGIGGGLWVPVAALAAPLRAICWVFPQYWLNKAVEGGVTNPAYLRPLTLNCVLILIGFAVLLLGARRVDLTRFRPI